MRGLERARRCCSSIVLWCTMEIQYYCLTYNRYPTYCQESPVIAMVFPNPVSRTGLTYVWPIYVYESEMIVILRVHLARNMKLMLQRGVPDGTAPYFIGRWRENMKYNCRRFLILAVHNISTTNSMIILKCNLGDIVTFPPNTALQLWSIAQPILCIWFGDGHYNIERPSTIYQYNKLAYNGVLPSTLYLPARIALRLE